MIVYNNKSDLTNVYLGNTNIAKVYIGTHQAYPSSTPPTPTGFKYKLTLSDSSVISGECDGTSAIYKSTLSAYSQTCVSAEVGDCVTVLRGSFNSFHNLSSITISSGVTEIDGAFEECSGLTSIELPKNLTTIGDDSFKYCTNLTGITIPNGVRSVGYAAFRYCYGINEIIIPDSVETIGPYAFVDCTGATNCTLGSGITIINLMAFKGCSNLNSITINAVTPPTIGNGVFDNTNNCPILVPCEAIEDYRTEWAEYVSRLQCIPTPSFKYKLTLSNGDIVSAETDATSAITRNEISAYSQTCVSAEVGDSVTTISNTAFGYFHNLSSVTISDSVVNIYGYAFAHCFSLTSIGDKGSGASIELPTGLTTIEDSAFEYCSGLTSVSIPSSITSIGYAAFGDCTSLPSIEIPSNVTLIDGHAFANCSGLTSITVNATVPPSSNGATSNWYAFNNTNNCPIYVPCESVEAYKSASGWSSYASRITCTPTPSYQWVSYVSGDTVPTATTVYGVRIYPLYDSSYNVTFSGSNGDYIRLYPDGFSDWVAVDENGTSINISSYRIRPGYAEYEIPFSDLGFGGMNIIAPITTFEDDIDLYITN